MPHSSTPTCSLADICQLGCQAARGLANICSLSMIELRLHVSTKYSRNGSKRAGYLLANDKKSSHTLISSSCSLTNSRHPSAGSNLRITCSKTPSTRRKTTLSWYSHAILCHAKNGKG